jgi:hypothetical protein
MSTAALPPLLAGWEEQLEDHDYGVGKLIRLDSPTTPVTPLVLRLPANLDPADPTLRIRLDWEELASNAGRIRLWTTAVVDELRNQADASQGGHRVASGILYSLDDLNYEPDTGEIVLYVEGTTENSLIKTLAGVEQYGRPDERVRATFVVNGNDAAFDEVKYIVVSKGAFFYELQRQRQLRNELASRQVYQPESDDDMPEFSMRVIGVPELLTLGVPPDIAALLGPEAGHGVAGFYARLYQDYMAGEDQYVLVFRGTDDDIWQKEWTDWLNNIAQGLGFAAEQYRTAMRIGDALVNATPGIPNGHLFTTGHSLGGGLSSAAAVAGGIPAHIFNAAGLHRDTLYRDVNGNLTPNETYGGSTARYDNAATFVTSYYVDFDLLNMVQNLTRIPNSIGRHYVLDGPHDLEVGGTAVLLGAALAAGQGWSSVAAGINGLNLMRISHSHPSLLYGLLVREGAFGNIDLDALGIETYFP